MVFLPGENGGIMKNIFQKIMDNLENFHPLSPSALRLVELFMEPEPSFIEMEKIIRLDPALTAEVLRLANNAENAPVQSISTVRTALARIGSEQVYRSLLLRGLRTSLVGGAREYGFDEITLWRHSVASACAAPLADRELQLQVGPIAFTAALLHDVGMIVLARVAGPSLRALVLEQGAGTICTLDYLEQDRLGVSHSMVGATMTMAWGLPRELSEAIRTHHQVGVDNCPLADLVRLADLLARLIGEGLGDCGTVESMDAGLFRRLGIGPRQLEALCANTLKEFQECTRNYG